MSIQIAFSLPNVPILRQIGAIVIKHGQLEHVQKIVLKRLLKITIHDERYAREVQGLLSRDLRKKIDAHIKTSALDQPTRAQLVKLLKEARRVSTERNKLVHSVWSREVRNNPREGRRPLMLQDKGKAPVSIPSIADLRKLANDIDVVRNQLNKLFTAIPIGNRASKFERRMLAEKTHDIAVFSTSRKPYAPRCDRRDGRECDIIGLR